MVQFLLQFIKGALRIFIITFKLRRLHQFCKLFLTDGVVGKAALDDPLFEFLPVGICQMELGCWGNRRMLGDIINHVVEHHLRRVLTRGGEVEGDIGDRVRFDLHIRFDTTTVAHLTAVAGIEHFRQRVGDMFPIAATAFLVVDGLDAAPAGDIVFRGRHLHVRVIGQVDGNLHQSLPVCTRT